MKRKRIVLTASLLAVVGILGACGEKYDVSIPTPVKTKPMPEKEVEHSKMPPLPTAQELTDVMQSYDSYSEYQGKLDEVGLTEPEYTLKDVVLAGDGVNEYKADVYMYKARDGYFALYARGDALIKEMPESIGMNVWTNEEADAFVKEKQAQ